MGLITYDDKQDIGTQPTIPNANKIKANDLNQIKTAINNSTDYSTTETVVGTYLDKPLYRKVIDFGTLPNATRKYVDHNISNLGYVRIIEATGARTDGVRFPIPFSALTLTYGISLNCTDTQVYIETGIDRSTITAYVTIEYTKTTD